MYQRDPEQVEVPPIEKEPLRYMALALVHLKEQMGALAKMIEDRSHPFDIYQPQTLIPESNNTITLQASYEMTERVTSILITGPAAANVVLQLGDRVWNLIIGVSGYINLGNLDLILSRSDTRQLTATVAGDYMLELMGHADDRT